MGADARCAGGAAAAGLAALRPGSARARGTPGAGAAFRFFFGRTAFSSSAAMSHMCDAMSLACECQLSGQLRGQRFMCTFVVIGARPLTDDVLLESREASAYRVLYACHRVL